MPANHGNVAADTAQAGRAGPPPSILVFRIGSLGDTLVSIPSFWALRQNFPGAKITLLCNQQVGKRYVLSADVLKGSGLIDDFLVYPGGSRGAVRFVQTLVLLWRLYRRHYEILVYLPPSTREPASQKRDRAFFQLVGIKRMIGISPVQTSTLPIQGQSTGVQSFEADRLLQRLAADGIRVPLPGEGRMELGIGQPEQNEVDRWMANLPPSGERPWIAVAPGSKMPAKIWPSERYAEVVSQLIQRFDVWPVVVGGPEDRPMAESLLEGWKRGYSAAGELSLRASAAAIGRCRLYLGNDTGAMHLSATVGVPCVAIFSSRAEMGRWYPYGTGHVVFRTAIDCEGCELEVCIDRKMECIRRIGVEEVSQACTRILEGSRVDLKTTAHDPGTS